MILGVEGPCVERHSEQAEVPSLFLSRKHVLTSSTYHLLLHLESCGICFPNTNSDLSEDVGSQQSCQSEDEGPHN